MRVLIIALAILIVTPACPQSSGVRTFDQSKINEFLDKQFPSRRQLPTSPNAEKPPGGVVATLPPSNSAAAPKALSDNPSIDCAKATANPKSSAVAPILCSGP